MRGRLVVWMLAVAAVGGAAPRGLAQPAPAPQNLVVFATSDTDGVLARPRCRRTPILTGDRLPYARQVGYYRQLVQRSRESDRSFAPIALHLGDSTYPGPLGRFLLAQGAGGAREFAEILAQLPYVSHTLGNREIGLRRSALNALADGAILEGLPLRALNVVCTSEGGAEALCEATGTLGDRRPYDVVDRGSLRVLLVSVVDPALRGDVAASRLTGLDLLSPEAALERRLPEFRRQTNPDLVFVQYHASDATDPSAVVELTREVSGIDVVTTNQQLAESAGKEISKNNGYIHAPGSGTYIVSAGRSPVHASVTGFRLKRVTDEAGRQSWRIRQAESRTVDTGSAPAAPSTAELLWQASERLCRLWGKPIAPNAPLAEPFGRRDFATFVLNVMRLTGRAEIGLINDGAIRKSQDYPIRRILTYADVYTFLPFENPLMILRVRGSALRDLKRELGESALAAGLEERGTSLLVNGRPIHDDRIYRVATSRFVAEGGDDIIPLDDIRRARLHDPAWSGETPSISDLVVHFVQSGRYVRRGRIGRRLSPRGNFPDLHRRLLWELVGSVNASYNQVAVANPTVDNVPVYNQSQLRVQPTRQLNLETALQANADSENHGWDNSLLVQYALARVDTGGELGQTRDLIRAKSLYKYAGIRSRLGDPWWGPMPTAELQAETEFDPPPRRDWHKLELTGILGSSFELTNRLEIKLGFDLRRDLSEPGGKTVYGVAGAYRLDRVELVDILGSPVQFESEFEYFFNDPFRERIHEIRTTSRLFFSVFQDLHVTSTFSAFLYRSGFIGAFGQNTELTFGVNYRWDEAFQTY